MSTQSSPRAPKRPQSLFRLLDRTVMWGALLIVFFFGFLFGWMSIAPLSSAAVATGVVSPDGSRKAIQHLEGGIIRDILVKDGDTVTRGQPLIRLEDLQAKAQFDAIHGQLLRLRAIKVRTEALIADAPNVGFPPQILELADKDAELRSFVNAQVDLFQTRRTAHKARRELLERQLQQIKEQQVGLAGELKGNKEQLALVEDELQGLETLYKDGNALKSRVMQLRRARAEIESKVSSASAALASSEQKIGELRVSLASADTEYRDKLSDEHMRINTEIAQIEERIGASRDVLSRTEIRAPTNGTIVGLRFKTRGGVVKPGDVLLELVPSNDELIIDARVNPLDINHVRVGQRAQVHLLPFQQRHMPIIEGNVIAVSADAITDQRTGESYFEAKIVIPRDHLVEVAPGVELQPGMPADVMIVTGERSAFRYMIEPIERSFRRSFRQI